MGFFGIKEGKSPKSGTMGWHHVDFPIPPSQALLISLGMVLKPRDSRGCQDLAEVWNVPWDPICWEIAEGNEAPLILQFLCNFGSFLLQE